MSRATKYDIAREYSAGFAAATLPAVRGVLESGHWHAGYDAGYSFRKLKNELLNQYLISIGHKPMAVVKALEATP